MSNPMVSRCSAYADEYLRLEAIPGLYCHSEDPGRKTREVDNFEWSELSPADLVPATT